MAAPRAYPSLTEEQQRAFWSKVASGPANQCWLWQAAIKGRGYGALTVNSQPLSSHRVAWELTHGPVPEGQMVYQVFCNNPACCNPAHMKTGTRSEAMHSASFHGTKLGRAVDFVVLPAQPRVQHAKPYPKLTEKQVRAFWVKVDKFSSPHGCWLWRAANTAGYGVFRVAGRGLRASRLSYAMVHGDPPSDIDVCHNCPGGDNPLCVNPAHLFTGSRKRNLQDCVEKGRKNAARGEAAGKAKLTPEQVYEVRRRYDAGESPSQIGAGFGISGPSVCAIGLRQSWRHLQDQPTNGSVTRVEDTSYETA